MWKGRLPWRLQDNILVTNRGKVKLIDFGAAVDMTSGINFNPQSSFMDPRYAAAAAAAGPPLCTLVCKRAERSLDVRLLASFTESVIQRPHSFQSDDGTGMISISARPRLGLLRQSVPRGGELERR